MARYVFIDLSTDTRSAVVASRLDEFGRLRLTLPRNTAPKNTTTLAYVSTEPGFLSYLAALRSGRAVGHVDREYELFEPLDLGDLEIPDLLNACESRYRTTLGKQLTQTRLLTRRASDQMMASLLAIRSQDRSTVERLHSLAKRDSDQRLKLSPKHQDERDALMLAASIFGGTEQRRAMAEQLPLRSDSSGTLTSALHSSVKLSETDAIHHDALNVLPSAVKDQLGAIVQLTDTHGRLTAFVTDRRPIEKSLGVDLVYHIPSNEEFILVQYKRMTTTQSEGHPVYRPFGDRNFVPEYKRMYSFARQWRRHRQRDAGDFRLLTDPFFFKFVMSAADPRDVNRLLPGLYISREHLKLTLKSACSIGPLGGRVISYAHCDRYLSNSLFIKLFREGWIGSAGIASDQIRLLLEDCFGRNTLVYAREDPNESISNDFYRDSLGRFTESDDPLGSAF